MTEMKRHMVTIFAAVAASCVLAATETIPLKAGWRFIKADDPSLEGGMSIPVMSDILDRADRGDLSNAPTPPWSRPAFDDASWRIVRVPHDWGTESSYNPARAYGDAFLDVTGSGWYRKEFVASEGWRGKKVMFQCDGAFSYAFVWINGRFVGGWPYGYTRFTLDITPHLALGKTNLLAVRCVNVPHSSRWYTGGGLYRDCRLLVAPDDHVLPDSVFISTPEVTRSRAKVKVEYEMSLSGRRSRSFYVDNPRLWDIDDPHLYAVDVEGNEYRYGIRTIAFHADERRFQLNGRTVPLNGVSMHHDFGALGAAWNREAMRRRLLLLKEAGVNAVRSSHNPPGEGLLSLCDELGLLVFDEVFDEWRYTGKISNGVSGDAGKRINGYTNLFDVWHERDLRRWVRTDRNHPCVIMYGLGNEIPDGKPYVAPTAEYVTRSRSLAAMATSEDPTRPTVTANNSPVNYTNEYPMTLSVMGCNYFAWMYPKLKEAYPDVPFFGTETICMSSSRGCYQFPVTQRWLDQNSGVENFRNSSYCWQAPGFVHGNNWACPPDEQWHYMDLVGTCMGDFIWTGFDYLGGPYWCDPYRAKPNFTDPEEQSKALAEVAEHGLTRTAIHTCNTGFFDRAGFRKDSFYLFQSRYMPDRPMAHIVPHWTWPGREGQVTPVYVFTTGDEGELFVNGRSCGRVRKQQGVWDRAYRLRWDNVKYEPGKVEVVVYRNGREWAKASVQTAQKPAALEIVPERDSIVSDGEDVVYVNVRLADANGTTVPDARPEVEFSVEGPGCVVATDNGDETDMRDVRSMQRKIFSGYAQAVIRAAPGSFGVITVNAKVDGIAKVAAKVAVRKPAEDGSLP